MLRNVVVGFLATVSERDFDLPFLALLSAEGFSDVHFTHGPAEFGKDFIGKRRDAAGTLEQWCFQSKAGDISLGGWREVSQQLLEAATVDLAHPSFDPGLPRRIVLVTTGRLTGQAPIAVQSFNTSTMVEKLRMSPIAVWDAESLAERLVARALAAFATTASDITRLGAFLTLYGDALQGMSSEVAIERHSRRWLAATSVFEATFEATLLAAALRSSNSPYEELHAMLGLNRALLLGIHAGKIPAEDATNFMELVRRGASDSASRQLSRIEPAWRSAARDLSRTEFGARAGPVHYLIHCARVAESAALIALISNDVAETERANTFLGEFAEREPGVAHPASDRYAVSVVWTVVALERAGSHALAREIVREAAIWVCDRYEHEGCLSSVDSEAIDEIHALLGEPFDFIPYPRRRQSLIGCAVADLAALLGDAALYQDVVNDLAATNICPQYWQAADTPGQFCVDAGDVVQYVNVSFASELSGPGDRAYAEHVCAEPPGYRVALLQGPEFYVGLSMLLRDRYFLALWPSLTTRTSAPTESSGGS